MPELSLSFLRPWWLLGIVPLLAAGFFAFRQSHRSSAWEAVVDPILQPYVIEPAQRTGPWSRWLLLLGWFFCLLTLSGPVWERQEIPVYQGQQAQVVLFDLSRSMYSEDVKPSRLARARFKLSDFLASAEGLQIALVAFAQRPYVISPLSDDANTIAAFVESLDPSIMPAQGSRIDLAINMGVDLLSQAGISQGQLVLITDSDVEARDFNSAGLAKSEGHLLSVIGIGTEKGAPLRGDDGRFLLDASGAIVVPQLNSSALSSLAQAGGGAYTSLTSDDSDLQLISRIQKELEIVGDTAEKQTTNEYWIEYGPYALLLLTVLALLFFRRGVIW